MKSSTNLVASVKTVGLVTKQGRLTPSATMLREAFHAYILGQTYKPDPDTETRGLTMLCMYGLLERNDLLWDRGFTITQRGRELYAEIAW